MRMIGIAVLLVVSVAILSSLITYVTVKKNCNQVLKISYLNSSKIIDLHHVLILDKVIIKPVASGDKWFSEIYNFTFVFWNNVNEDIVVTDIEPLDITPYSSKPFKLLNISTSLPVRIKGLSKGSIVLIVRDYRLYRIEYLNTYSPEYGNPNLVISDLVNGAKYIFRVKYSLLSNNTYRDINIVSYVKQYLINKYYMNYFIVLEWSNYGVEVTKNIDTNTGTLYLWGVTIINYGNNPVIISAILVDIYIRNYSRIINSTKYSSGIHIRLMTRVDKHMEPGEKWNIYEKIPINFTELGLNIASLENKKYVWEYEVYVITNKLQYIRLLRNVDIENWEKFLETKPVEGR